MGCEHCEHCKRIIRAANCDHPLDQKMIKPEDDMFYQQIGCLKCDTWLQPVRVKNDKRKKST